MTLQELYVAIDGDYEQAIRVLRIEKLLDKHIRRFPSNPIFENLFQAEETMDPSALFENAHAIKGVCANLGLVKIAAIASDIAEEYRPGNSRELSDDEVKARIREISDRYQKAAEGIRAYEQAL